MNIAFPAFFIFLLIIPGFIFLSAYEKSENTTIERKPFDSSSAIAFLVSAIIHIIFINLFVPITGNNINFPICIKLLTGIHLSAEEISKVGNSSTKSFLYFITIFIFSFLLGKLLQKLIFFSNPYKSSYFAFNTPWYYELKGKLSDIENADFIKLSCLEETKEGSFLYYGILEDFYLSSDGQLDRIVMSQVNRRHLSSDDSSDNPENTPDRFYEIKGDRLVLKYQNIKNINIEYIYLEPAEDHSKESETT